jgi:hypothetical protein
MTDYLAAARRGDWDRAFGFFAPDILMHVPGRSAFAGDRQGKEAAAGYIESPRDRYRNGNIELELIDMLISDGRVALLVRERFHGDGHPIRPTRCQPDVHARQPPLRTRLADRHQQHAFSGWGEIFGDEVTAAAMIDRLVHHAEILALKGDSYRLKDRDLARPARDD